MKSYRPQHTQPTNERQTFGRRTIVKGAAWSVPVIATATAAPLAAASGTTNPCTPISAVLTPSVTSVNPLVLTTTDASGANYTIVVGSKLGENTVVTERAKGNGESYNFTQGQSGWNGGAERNGSDTYVFHGFGEPGAIVLNQRTEDITPNYPVTGAVDSQILTFNFFRNGASFNPTNFSITIFDISSNVASDAWAWRANYWDAVGFTVTPSAIVSSASTTAGSGAGTFADPFHRANGDDFTTTDRVFNDRFDFGAFPSGSQMVYTQHDGRQGWHFVSISAISFGIDQCV